MTTDTCPSCNGWKCDDECVPYWRGVESDLRAELRKLHVLLHEVRSECKAARDDAARLDELCTQAKQERDAAVDRADKMHLLGLKFGRELADLERENASLRRRLREGGR